MERLAERIETTPPNLSSVKAGRRGLTPRQCVLLAKILAEDPRDILALDAIHREKDTAHRAALFRALFRLGTPGAGAGRLIGATVAALPVAMMTAVRLLSDLTIYTLGTVTRARRFA